MHISFDEKMKSEHSHYPNSIENSAATDIMSLWCARMDLYHYKIKIK